MLCTGAKTYQCGTGKFINLHLIHLPLQPYNIPMEEKRNKPGKSLQKSSFPSVAAVSRRLRLLVRRAGFRFQDRATMAYGEPASKTSKHC